ncbi:YcgN family cysteine cluster protein [Alkanindiges sp. WGS2144]|uniref:YcgN family cysteine cluster protein n=1 Tax=Alkanindiges sp. WGS2144 TaxID=3366808 RepID=UPI0037515170
MSLLRPHFWKHYPLDQLNPHEWEALCDGCGLCCLVKLEDEDNGEVVYTKVACKLLDTQTAQCSDYARRQQFVPDCLQLTPAMVPDLHWLPKSCAYKRVHMGLDLPNWHPLITGKARSDIPAKKSVAGRCISETDIDPDDIEEYVVKWVR